MLALRLLGNLTDNSDSSPHASDDGKDSTSPDTQQATPKDESQQKTGTPKKDVDDTGVGFCHQNKLEFIEAVMMVSFSCHTISPYQKVRFLFCFCY